MGHFEKIGKPLQHYDSGKLYSLHQKHPLSHALNVRWVSSDWRFGSADYKFYGLSVWATKFLDLCVVSCLSRAAFQSSLFQKQVVRIKDLEASFMGLELCEIMLEVDHHLILLHWQTSLAFRAPWGLEVHGLSDILGVWGLHSDFSSVYCLEAAMQVCFFYENIFYRIRGIMHVLVLVFEGLFRLNNKGWSHYAKFILSLIEVELEWRR